MQTDEFLFTWFSWELVLTSEFVARVAGRLEESSSRCESRCTSGDLKFDSNRLIDGLYIEDITIGERRSKERRLSVFSYMTNERGK